MLFLYTDTSSTSTVHNCESSLNYCKEYISIRADTNLPKREVKWEYLRCRQESFTEGQMNGRNNATLIAISHEPFGRKNKSFGCSMHYLKDADEQEAVWSGSVLFLDLSHYLER